MITTDKQARKNAPVYSGCLAYFPKAITLMASRHVEDDPRGRTNVEALAALLAGEDISADAIQNRAEQTACCALELLQEELTGGPCELPYEADGVHSFLVRYAEALLAVAELSRVGAEQHNPGKPLFWDRSKSGDELDALARHLLEAGKIDVDGVRHSTKVCWRALANLEKAIEREAGEKHPPLPANDPNAIVTLNYSTARMVSGEYRDPESGLIKDLAKDEVRLKDGSVVKLTWQGWAGQVYIGTGTGLYWGPRGARLASRQWALREDQLPRVKAFYELHNPAPANRA